MANSVNEVKKQCGFCSGNGKVAEDGFDGEIITCPICQGNGQVTVLFDTVLHLICDGNGKIKLKGRFGKEMVLCPDCKGTGWFKSII
jgi:DnaJ-class molecular chaperone